MTKVEQIITEDFLLASEGWTGDSNRLLLESENPLQDSRSFFHVLYLSKHLSKVWTQVSEVWKLVSGINSQVSKLRTQVSKVRKHVSEVNSHVSKVWKLVSEVKTHASKVRTHASKVRKHASEVKKHVSISFLRLPACPAVVFSSTVTIRRAA